MKDVDTAGAPMISVPAGVLKEFMSPANSRTPTPPLQASSSTITTSSDTTTMSPAQSPSLATTITNGPGTPNTTNTNNGIVKSRTPTPTPTSRTASPVLALPISKSSVTLRSATVPIHINGKTELKNEEEEGGEEGEGEEENKDEKNIVTLKKEEVEESMDSTEVKSDTTSTMVNGTGSPQLPSSVSSTTSTTPSPAQVTVGMKRPSEDEGNKPDLKKFRVVSSLNKHGFKNRNITVKEVNKALDLESKKIQEANKWNNQSLVTLSRIKNGIAVLNGERLSSTDSPSHSPSSTPSPSPAIVQEGEDTANPEANPIPPEQTPVPVPIEEQDSANKENHKSTRSKEMKLTKNGLKDAILRVFSDNTLYGSELGNLKQMCEKLTSTLESNMRKVAQFHKEIEDLRKVTTRLAAEHQARKGQYVAPIRIKRSVGIQAAPHIINKGIMHANVSGGNIKTIAPRTSNMVGMLPSSVGQNLVPGSTLGIITTSAGIAKPATLTGIPTGAPVLPAGTPTSLGTAVRAPNGQIMMMAPAATMQPLTRPPGAKGVVNRNSLVPKPGALVKVPTTATAQLVPLPAGGVGQVVLLPNTSGGQPTTALIVSQVSTGQSLENIGNPAVAQARMSTVVNHTSSAARVQGATPPATVRSTPTTSSPTTTIPNTQMRHPAPLPKTPFQQVGGISKKLPPQPTLKLSHKESSIVLSWTMAKTEDHETIASYQLYAYQEGAAPPSANLWKKVGSVKALELPMACTLTQFMPGHVPLCCACC
ncbi:activating transcription factor 7-interacting protein 1-like isoform X2 [Portunus trituberculatus]|uniref:activating transcription factor 7-interacting protein 1-like isoform X2 n=1 Tax=Portunus trituberculatus TaxID=210409 RepID=UPI001E1D1A32|nr:activating transcription factor 7-interacting protein 1-like isoform X2 [Portunus trituberculatus]XP_045105756.1 activating transcription factor 7-interacting protein 1-like isoform X2 [Portunus trituberculatus]XP_045105757.1 activating transcription factor 7-interacting protein 1-like isoform X2 [Portunus trituberculatus]